MAKLISQVYGDALFELAIEEEKTEVFMEEMQGILQVLSENQDFDAVMSHPNIAKQEKVQLMETVFGGHISKELLAFFALVIEKNRYNAVEEIFEFFSGRDQGSARHWSGKCHNTPPLK